MALPLFGILWPCIQVRPYDSRPCVREKDVKRLVPALALAVFDSVFDVRTSPTSVSKMQPGASPSTLRPSCDLLVSSQYLYRPRKDTVG